MGTVTVKNANQIIDTITTNSPDQTIDYGRRFAKKLMQGSVVALFGELGSGKTTFVKGICEGLKIEGSISSPTFTLINEYEGSLPVYHFDFYRIGNADEAWQIGCEDYFYGDGVCLIEWPENIATILPTKRIEVRVKSFFDQGFENKREIRIIQK